MKFVFFGNAEFSQVVLEELIRAGFLPQAVICGLDKPVGRKRIITPPLVKRFIWEEGIKTEIFQPGNTQDLKAISSQLKSIGADLFLIASYPLIIPEEVLKIPLLGAIGVHPSLLPKYRGPAPVQFTILNGESRTGITLFLLDGKLDHGPIISKSEIEVSGLDIFPSLRDKLAKLAGDLLIETLPKFVRGEITPLPQDESQATYTKKFITEDAFVLKEDLIAATSGSSLEKAIEIDRKIRALNPEPGVFTLRMSKGGPRRVKLLEAEAKDNRLVLKKIQEAGKNPTAIS